MFETDFFTHHPESLTAYRETIARTAETLAAVLPAQPVAGGSPTQVAAAIQTGFAPLSGKPFEDVLVNLRAVIKQSVMTGNPRTVAHLHPPVLIAGLAAELVLSALNNSMDSFDQGPAAAVIEEQVIGWLCQLAGLPPAATGTFTAGGTQSNYFGLLLARDHFVTTRWNWLVRQKGLPPEANRLRILCSEIAHFSVDKSAVQLGLGTEAVVKVAVDERYRMRADALVQTIVQLQAQGLVPFAIVATEGTTDFGSFDPLEPLAKAATDYGLWLHVDAAYGGALLLSEQQRGKLAAIGRADSVTIDFHKAFFQPISCGAFLLADGKRFELIRLHADYLNPESYEQGGIPDLVRRSLLTTRRFDALKLWVSLQSIGLEKFGQMVERLIELARFAAGQIEAAPDLELLHPPEFGCVVFRYCSDDAERDEVINEALPRRVFEEGVAVLGHTVVNGKHCLKLTLNNPTVMEGQVVELLEVVRWYGRGMESR
jgi:L-2,4-diaminobutyrate decarboxylase